LGLGLPACVPLIINPLPGRSNCNPPDGGGDVGVIATSHSAGFSRGLGLVKGKGKVLPYGRAGWANHWAQAARDSL